MTTRQPRDTVLRHECGWTSKRTTAAFAAKALRVHSCEKFRREAEAYERNVARDREIDRTPKPCLHPVANHQHGTRVAYTLDGCRCLPCSRARSQYAEDLNRRVAYGEGVWADAAPVREHIHELGRAGVGVKTVAARAGLSASVLTKLLYGFTRPDGTHRAPSERVRRATADAVMAVKADEAAPGARVDSTGTRRRLQALVALGWSVQQVADRAALNRQVLDKLIQGRWFTIARTVHVVREVYTALASTSPPEDNHRQRIAASRSRRWATQEGWLVPAWWDDETIDDPAIEPGAPDSPSRDALDLDEWAFLVGGGESLERAASRCGVTLSAVEQAIHRSGHDAARLALAERRAAA